MEWQQLEYFHVVAQSQHFTRAAEHLSISQPALSRSIAQLEKELGVPLFDRQGRSVRLNIFGQKFHDRTMRILNEMGNAKRDIQNMLDPECGDVSLAFLKSLGINFVPRLVRRYLDDSPNVNFRLFQNSTSAMIEQLLLGEIGLCLSSLTDTPPEIEWRKLWTEEMFIFVHKDHPHATKENIRLSEIADEKFVVLKQGYGSREIFDELFTSIGRQPKIAFEGEEVVSVLGFVSENLGIALLPFIAGMNMQDIVKLSICDRVCGRTIGLAWRKDKYMSPVSSKFKDFIFSRLKTPSSIE